VLNQATIQPIFNSPVDSLPVAPRPKSGLHNQTDINLIKHQSNKFDRRIEAFVSNKKHVDLPLSKKVKLAELLGIPISNLLRHNS
jgi:hypothetical protein